MTSPHPANTAVPLQARATGLPFLPGTDFNILAGKHFHKSHAFDIHDRCKFEKPNGIKYDGYPVPPKGIGNQRKVLLPPAWLSRDARVLRFEATFGETVNESQVETWRTRRVFILYYLEDNTVQIIEPRTHNSGLVQGNYLRRLSAEGLFDPVHMENVIGAQVALLGRTFTIVGCDQFTSIFLRVPHEAGLSCSGGAAAAGEGRVGEAKGVRREQGARHAKPTPPREYKLERFLRNDGRVLRVYTMWTERGQDPKYFVVHYYLADDTVEVVGFLKRDKLPKPAFLQRAGHREAGGGEEWYADRDFLLGNVVYVYGRPMLVYDWDGFTGEYFEKEYGIRNPEKLL